MTLHSPASRQATPTAAPSPDTAPPAPPAGFQRLAMPRGFIGTNGPLYMRQDAAGGVELGMLVEARHGNPMGVCHGGMLLTFADILLAVTVRHAEPQLGMMPTVSMSTDFLSGAPVGSFLIGSGRLLKRTRRLAFADGRVTAGDRPVLRLSGILKIPSQPLVPADRLPAGVRPAAAGHPNDDGPLPGSLEQGRPER